MSLPYDTARCAGVQYNGEWRDDSPEALRRDAERYRWLRNSGATIRRTMRTGEEREHVEVHASVWTRRATLDEAVDVAMRARLGSRAANARLIAAAPDPLAMLVEAHDIIDAIGQPETAKVAARMRATIAQAKGES